MYVITKTSHTDCGDMPDRKVILGGTRSLKRARNYIKFIYNEGTGDPVCPVKEVVAVGEDTIRVVDALDDCETFDIVRIPRLRRLWSSGGAELK